jgi:hypothetical protein
MREQIAAKRAETRSTPVKQRPTETPRGTPRGSRFEPAPAESALEDKSVIAQLKKAAKSGTSLEPNDQGRGSVVLKSRLIGRLDLDSLDLHRIPAETYIHLLGLPAKELTRPPSPPPEPTIGGSVNGLTESFGRLGQDYELDRNKAFGQKEQEEQWDCVELIALRAGDNRIRELEPEIGSFGGLKSIDVSSSSSAQGSSCLDFSS